MVFLDYFAHVAYVLRRICKLHDFVGKHVKFSFNSVDVQLTEVGYRDVIVLFGKFQAKNPLFRFILGSIKVDKVSIKLYDARMMLWSVGYNFTLSFQVPLFGFFIFPPVLVNFSEHLEGSRSVYVGRVFLTQHFINNL